MLPGIGLSFLVTTQTAFVPTYNTYTTGSGTETAPDNATYCTIILTGGGAGGGSRTGGHAAGGKGGKGGKVVKSITVSGGDTISYTVGSYGSVTGIPGSTGLNGANTTANTGTGGFSGLNLLAGGGNGGTSSSDGTGGVASGGDTNTVGGADGASGDNSVWDPELGKYTSGAQAGSDPGGGGGGGNDDAGGGARGGYGRIVFYYT